MLDRGAQRLPGADGQHDGSLGAQELLEPDRRRGRDPGDGVGRGGIGGRDVAEFQPEPAGQAGRELQAVGDRVIQPELDEPLADREGHEPLRRLPRHVELGRDLGLRVAGDVVEPRRPCRLFQPSTVLVVPRPSHPSRPRPIAVYGGFCLVQGQRLGAWACGGQAWGPRGRTRRTIRRPPRERLERPAPPRRAPRSGPIPPSRIADGRGQPRVAGERAEAVGLGGERVSAADTRARPWRVAGGPLRLARV
jgi:hypothetical protein